MTLPDERTRAVQNTHRFLLALQDKRQTPGVPKAIREWAQRLMRHYPWDMYLDESAEKLPSVWGKPEKADYLDEYLRRGEAIRRKLK